VLYEVLRGHEHDPGPSALALRLMGAVHRIVLRGDAELARHYPSAAGEPRNTWPAFLATVRVYADALRRLVDDPVQTNEPARCAACSAAFSRSAAAPACRWAAGGGRKRGAEPALRFLPLRARRRALGTGRLGRCAEVAPERAPTARRVGQGGGRRGLRCATRRSSQRGRPAHAHLLRVGRPGGFAWTGCARP
jgi:hypothetical protein